MTIPCRTPTKRLALELAGGATIMTALQIPAVSRNLSTGLYAALRTEAA